MCADQQWKYNYELLQCNHLTGIPLKSTIEIAGTPSLGICFLLCDALYESMFVAFYCERCKPEVRMKVRKFVIPVSRVSMVMCKKSVDLVQATTFQIGIAN